MRNRIGKVAVGTAVAALALTGCANLGNNGGGGDESASTYPEDVIQIIVPFDAGGVTDVLTRIVAEGVADELGSQVQVVNVPGAGGSIGLSQLSAEKADGYTIGTLNMPSGLSFLDETRALTYDLDSFAPVAGLATSPTVIAVRADSPWETFEDLVDAAAADPGQITLAGGTNITSDDSLTVSALEKEGVDFNVISIDTGGADKTTQLLGGQIQVSVGSLGSISVAVDSGQAKLLAVSTPERSDLIPDVPTLIEEGYDIQTSGNVTFAAPAGTPEEDIQILADAIEKALTDPEIIETAKAAGYEITFRGPQELGDYWNEQLAAAQEILGL